MIPTIFMNKLWEALNTLKVRNSQYKKYVIRFEIFDAGSVFLRGGGWRRFVKDIEYPEISKLCFVKEPKNTWLIRCFNTDGFEHVDDPKKGDIMESCLVSTSEETCFKQDMPPLFLIDFKDRRSGAEFTSVRVDGQFQGGMVNLSYVFNGPDDMGRAVGFHGTNWTAICGENQIDPGLVLMFNHKRQEEFSFNIFNSQGLCLDMNVSITEEEEPDYVPDEYSSDDDVEEQIIEDWLSYRCSHVEHLHNPDNHHFYKKLEAYNLSRNALILHKDFVRENTLHLFDGAFLYFGTWLFFVRFQKKLDKRRVGDENHLLMESDWSQIVEDVGRALGKMLRFEFNVQETVGAKVADFDMC